MLISIFASSQFILKVAMNIINKIVDNNTELQNCQANYWSFQTNLILLLARFFYLGQLQETK